MFVRWKRQLLRKSVKWEGMAPDYGLYAVLIESFMKEGKPRQRFIKHLGSISENDMKKPLLRQQFWKQVEEALEDLELLPEERSKIRARLSEKINPPTC